MWHSADCNFVHECHTHHHLLFAGAPVALSACKSALGHAETGAGAVGMLRAVRALQSGSQHEILHLRAVNPYVASTLAATAAKNVPTSAASVGWSAPRQPGPLATPAATSSADQPRCSGVSAFAFQGTNAHVTLASAPAAADCAASAALDLLWERRRFWYLPEPHALLSRALGWGSEQGTVAMELQLSRPRVAYLTDHQARRLSRSFNTAPAVLVRQKRWTRDLRCATRELICLS